MQFNFYNKNVKYSYDTNLLKINESTTLLSFVLDVWALDMSTIL